MEEAAAGRVRLVTVKSLTDGVIVVVLVSFSVCFHAAD